MMTSRERSITVDRIKLIEQLKLNLAFHKADYAEAVVGYKIKLVADLEDKLSAVKMLSEERVLDIKAVPFNPPHSYEKEYLDAIEMLEWSTDASITLDQATFKQYVQDEWNWKQSFDVMNTTYKSFAVGASLN